MTFSNSTFVGQGNGHIEFDPFASTGRGLFHGTGDFAGMTMWQDLSPGDFAPCPATHPDYGYPLFDATHIEGFITGGGD
jgi:hypothetical protein